MYTGSVIIYNVKFETKKEYTDNGLTIRNTPLLAEGTWNNVSFIESELKNATWVSSYVLDKHTDDYGMGANIIGTISNQHFEDGAVKGDVFISNTTNEGRKMIEYIKEDLIDGISVEMKNDEYQVANNVVSTNIKFMSAAIVANPACKVCRLENKEETKMSEKIEEMVSKLQDTVAEQGELIKKLSEVDVDAVIAEQSRKDAKVIDGLKEQITKLENTPVQNTVVEVEGIEPYAGYNYERGTVTRVI